jgi:transposase
MPALAEFVDGVIGVDSHRDTLAAAALSAVGGVLAQTAVRADAAGYQALLSFADAHVAGRRCWAIEGAGSYGAGLAAVLHGRGEQVVEAGRPKRPPRRSSAKTDAIERSALPATPSASRPSSWPQSASGATTRRCGCC